MWRPLLDLCAAALTIVVGVVATALFVQRRWKVRTDLFGLGALAFVGAQAVHIPLLIALTALFKHGPEISATAKLTVNVIILGGTAGLFEELARWVLLRRPQTGANRWIDAVAFGLGHGGFEALFVALSAPVSGAYLLAMGDTLIAQVKAADPSKAELVSQQVEAVRHATLGLAFMSTWERAMAMALHVALTLVVWKAVQLRRFSLVVVAILWHAVVDGLAVLAASKGVSALHIELGMSAATVLSIVVIITTRPRSMALT